MEKQPFNKDWRFFLGEPHRSSWRWKADDAWRKVNLPHDWSIELPRKAENISSTAGGYFEMGCGWYLKEFDAPAAWEGKKISLEFEGVYMNAEIWLNDHFLYRHPYGYTTFQVDLTPFLKLGESNLLRVRVDNSHQVNSRWYSGSGIYRPVWLVVSNPIHFKTWGITVTTPQITAQNAMVRSAWCVVNESTEDREVEIQAKVSGPGGAEIGEMRLKGWVNAGEEKEFIAQINARDPQLWSPDSPFLYKLHSELTLGGELLGREDTVFGIRSISFSAETGFLLNGQPVKLKGGCVHHDNGILGAASYPRAEERKVELHKASGYNAIRTAHNPPAPAFLEACDRLGMLVMDEAFDCWHDGKNIGDYHVAFADWWQRDIAAMVERDKNHPCIFSWSIGNEVLERDRPEGAQIARMLAEEVRRLDPTRPVTSAICGSWTGTEWEDTDDTYAQLELGGYNYQWEMYESDHERFPERMMIGTESFPIQAWENWDQVEKNSYVLGDFVWTSLDYLGETGIGRTVYAGEEDDQFLGVYPWHQANCGDLDLTGFKRPQSWYRDILWKADAGQYIAVHEPIPAGKERNITRWGWPLVWNSWNWAGCEGQTFKVDVYSPFAEVELFLNGVSQGSVATEKHIASFEVAYQPGELRAVGKGGKEGSQETILSTSGEAEGLRLSLDRETCPQDGLVYAAVEILDGQGRLQPTADRKVRFSASGPGRIIAVGSADPVSEEIYVGGERSTFKGRVLAVVQVDGAGEVVVKAEAEGLKSAEGRITCAG